MLRLAEDAIKRAIDDADQAIVELTGDRRVSASNGFDQRIVVEQARHHDGRRAVARDDPKPGLPARTA